ncbi:MAG TPA: hypothetical protein VMD97_02870 [Candidatus Aquilonibacter sp.]|nr:hypothetical protein [Candidatus Aquilonibacter sp.]
MRVVGASALMLSLVLVPAAAARGQVGTPQTSVSNTTPSNNFGFNLPTHLGTLSYALSGSEIVGTGYGNGTFASTTALSGDLAYLSTSETDPFSLIYSGGYLYTNVPGTSSSSTFQNLAASQVFRTRSWVYVISDSFSYLPESPTTGLSGIAGVGDVGVFPVTGLGPSQDILTDYARRIGNGVQGSATWQLTPSLDLEGSGSQNILHFLGGSSDLNSDEVDASLGPSYRIDVRNQIGFSGYYSRITYPNFSLFKIESEGVNLMYTRAWSRRLSTSIAAGPENTHGYSLGPIPARVNFSAAVSATYNTRTTGFSAGYTRGVNAGSGVLYGALSDTVTAGMNRPINRDWTLGVDGGFSRSAELVAAQQAAPTFRSVYGGIQISRRITETLSAYASYTGIHQSFENQPGVTNAFNGLNQNFAVGITFAPPPLLRGH